MNPSLDLIPQAKRQASQFKHHLIRWGILAIGCGLVIVFMSVATRSDLEWRQAELEFRRDGENKVKSIMKTIEDYRGRIKEVSAIEQHLDGLHSSDDLLQTLGTISLATNQTTSASPPTLRRLSIDLTKAPQAQDDSEEISEAPVCVKFDIVAMHEIPIHSALDSLRSHPRYRDVKIRSTSQEGDRNLKRFDVEASVMVEKEVPK